MELVYPVARGALIAPLRKGLRWTVEGAHLIPPYGPAILASNHISYLDPFTLAYVADLRHRRIRFLAKQELFAKRGLAPVLRDMRQIPVARGTDHAASSLDAAVEALHRGECVAVFPEGTISLDLDPMPGKTGAARLAQESGVPVTPVGLWGTHRILFKGRKPDWKLGVAQVGVVRPPVHVGAHDDVVDATDRIMEQICAAVARARALYPQRPVPGEDDWWVRPPKAELRSCRVEVPA